jgi:hypothetical protein
MQCAVLALIGLGMANVSAAVNGESGTVFGSILIGALLAVGRRHVADQGEARLQRPEHSPDAAVGGETGVTRS